MARTSLKHRLARLVTAPLPALALFAIGTAANTQPALPAGGTVVAGSASISAATASGLTVTQSSARAIVDWNGFSVGQGGSVRFDNGAGATLNRVTGAAVSSIDGVLSASGSVYLINPNGVVIGTSGVVDVGGSFVATTLGIGDDAFMAGGDLGFAGGSDAAVINLGRVGALGGDVALIASRVENRGTITAANGTAGLLAGTDVLLRDAALDGGRFVVRVGGSGTSATNAGTIAAAAAELRANGGNVYALAGDTGGAIGATGVAAHDGRIWLTAGDSGTVQVAGTLTARGANGAPGKIETSGGTVQVGAATIDAGAGGIWLLDPTDLTIDQTAANTIAGTLNAGTNVTQQTSAAGTGGSGDITVQDNVALTWGTNAALTLSAYRNVVVGFATITSTGGGAITLYADNTGTGTGTFLSRSSAVPRFSTNGPLTIYYSSADPSPPRFAYIYSGQGAVTTYKLINNATDFQNINANLSGTYALGRDLDGAGLRVVGAPTPTGTGTATFTGIFDGQGHAISNFSGGAISDYATPFAGLFAKLAAPAIVRNLNLIGGTVTGTLVASYYSGTGGPGAVGALAGSNDGGTIQNVSSSIAVAGYGMNYVGGLVGVNNSGTITNSYATGPVTGASATITYTGLYPGQSTMTVAKTANTGGLVGGNGGTITNSYATGSVNGTASTNTGGFAGLNSGTIDGAYASGATVGMSGGVTAGFVAMNTTNPGAPTATITNAYWDQGSTGQSLGFGTNSGSITRFVGIGGDTGFSPYAQSTYTHFTFDNGGTWLILDGQTRPLLATEYATTVHTPHQLQLIATNLGASYTLAGDIDLSTTGTAGDVWNPATGFAPIGSDSTPFTGSLTGAGHLLSGVSITRSNAVSLGLFGVVGPNGAVRNLTLLNAAVTGRESSAGATGALAGVNYGTIANVLASVTISATGGVVGGLVGNNAGTISDSRTTGTVTGFYTAGGVAGSNGGAIARSSSSAAIVSTGTDRQVSVGGLVGSSSGSVSDSYALGNVLGSASANVGGLVGSLGNTVGPFSFTFGTITRSYATGAVRGGVVGAIVGTSSGKLSDSYWDAGVNTVPAVGVATGGAITNVTAVGGTSGNSAYAAATYTALDLGASGPWVIFDGSTRPILRAEYATRITDAHQVQLIALDPTATYMIARDVALNAIYGRSDVWNPATGFVPIGSAAAPFSGTLDGQGHSLGALFINLPDRDNVGLFAGVSGTVTNLRLPNAIITGRGNVGAVAGFNLGTIGNVFVSGNATGGNSVGGLVGYNLGVVANVGAGTIPGITAQTMYVIAQNFGGGLVGYNAGAVTGTANGSFGASGSYGGGLVGYNDRQASVSGTVTGNISAHDYAGGIAGFSGGTIAGSAATGVVGATRGAGGVVGFNTGVVTGSSASAFVGASDLAGGFVGVNYGTIGGQSASGSVNGGTQQGGFAGANASGGTLTNVSASGSVTGMGTLGGLVGYNDGAIAASFATGSIAPFPMSNAPFVGGLVGYNARSITGSYATGAVAGGTFVGGLVGYSDRLGTIANSAAYARVNGVQYAGGLAGFNAGAIDSSQTNSAVSATDRGAGGLVAYNTGTITRAFANGSVAAPALSGGLVGLNFGSITVSYANASASGTDSVGGLVGANAGTLAKVYATGSVSGATQVGGLLGYSRGSVTDVYATGAVTGSDASTTGGLVGFADPQSVIARGYASGAVTRGGGVAGTNNGMLSATFYDAGTTGAALAVVLGGTTGTAAVGGPTGRGAYAQASYPGLNFLDVWTIQQGQSRPTLQDNPQNPAPR